MCSFAFQEAVQILEEARQRRRWVGKFWSFWFQNIMNIMISLIDIAPQVGQKAEAESKEGDQLIVKSW